MLDFTSALYLGLRHPSSSLRPWSQFSTGVPAALSAPAEAETVANQLAQLQGCEHGTLASSTLHLFWDLFGLLARLPVAIFIDAGTYPIARWGVERAAARGIPMQTFAHHDPEALRRKLKRELRGELPVKRRPLLVTDGFCPDCGKSAPLSEYLDIVRSHAGRLIVDDSQALGIFGDSPSRDFPYGRHGGGMIRQSAVAGPDVLVISSMAKAFGVPVAVLSGSRRAVENFKRKSETRVHCSPPSVPIMRAAAHAMQVNSMRGDSLRLGLAGLVKRFNSGAARVGFRFNGGLFPVQTLVSRNASDSQVLHRRLHERGIRTILRRSSESRELRITFVVTARHTPQMIDHALANLANV